MNGDKLLEYAYNIVENRIPLYKIKIYHYGDEISIAKNTIIIDSLDEGLIDDIRAINEYSFEYQLDEFIEFLDDKAKEFSKKRYHTSAYSFYQLKNMLLNSNYNNILFIDKNLYEQYGAYYVTDFISKIPLNSISYRHHNIYLLLI